jgi:hypothetical protein
LLSRTIIAVLIPLLATGCAGAAGGRDEALTVGNLPRFPACDAEIKALVALVNLAKQAGDNWDVFAPALQALQDQVVDCVDDNYPNPLPI